MYFPYFRGRQYELLALKELAADDLLGKSVIPIIEPIKLTTTFATTLKVFIDNQQPIALIYNPSVGELISKLDLVETLFTHFGNSSCVIPSVLFDKNAKDTLQTATDILQKTLDAVLSKGISTENLLTIIHNRDFLDVYSENFRMTPPKYTLCPDERQIIRKVNQNKVLCADRFIKQVRNADYPEDEFFSDDHLFFQDDGYIGFGDYSIVGKDYVDKGGLPYAVAIHVIYFSDDDTLRVRHFISDSNVDRSDVAGKYHEAVTKLANWYHTGQQQQQTAALLLFLDHAEKGYYPGLPTIKKLSMMHHLELVGKYLDNGGRR